MVSDSDLMIRRSNLIKFCDKHKKIYITNDNEQIINIRKKIEEAKTYSSWKELIFQLYYSFFD